MIQRFCVVFIFISYVLGQTNINNSTTLPIWTNPSLLNTGPQSEALENDRLNSNIATMESAPLPRDIPSAREEERQISIEEWSDWHTAVHYGMADPSTMPPQTLEIWNAWHEAAHRGEQDPTGMSTAEVKAWDTWHVAQHKLLANQGNTEEQSSEALWAAWHEAVHAGTADPRYSGIPEEQLRMWTAWHESRHLGEEDASGMSAEEVERWDAWHTEIHKEYEAALQAQENSASARAISTRTHSADRGNTTIQKRNIIEESKIPMATKHLNTLENINTQSVVENSILPDTTIITPTEENTSKPVLKQNIILPETLKNTNLPETQKNTKLPETQKNTNFPVTKLNTFIPLEKRLMSSISESKPYLLKRSVQESKEDCPDEEIVYCEEEEDEIECDDEVYAPSQMAIMNVPSAAEQNGPPSKFNPVYSKIPTYKSQAPLSGQEDKKQVEGVTSNCDSAFNTFFVICFIVMLL